MNSLITNISDMLSPNWRVGIAENRDDITYELNLHHKTVLDANLVINNYREVYIRAANAIKETSVYRELKVEAETEISKLQKENEKLQKYKLFYQMYHNIKDPT